MSTKHTPGPWFVKKTAMSCFIDARIGGGMLQEVAWCGQTATPEHMDANARLIAAAPDLLEALNRLLITAECVKRQADNSGKTPYTDWRSAVDDLTKVSDKARAAIAKATGEQS
jgi:hypothetical protein